MSTQVSDNRGARSSLVARERSRARILAAARQCFKRQDPRRVTMEDVARAAGTGRQALYRYFSGRDELVEAAIVARVGELADVLKVAADLHPNFETAVVEISVATVEAARNDEELHRLFEASSGLHLNHLLAGQVPAVQEIALRVWRPWFDRGRVNGAMRLDVTDEDAIEWIQGTYATMILRDDMEVGREREMLRLFLVPALIPGARRRDPRPGAGRGDRAGRQHAREG